MTIQQQENPQDSGQPFDLAVMERVYEGMPEKVDAAREKLGRGLTLTEKILYAHLHPAVAFRNFARGESFVDFAPDRVAMQDATAQMALLQFMQAGKPQVAVPSTVHCDHLITARVNGKSDLAVAKDEGKEVYDFLESVSNKYGIGFWKPGAGIIHQVVLENYAFPGGMMIGSDSHTVNAGGLGMMAIGVGGADVCDVMAGLPWELLMPKIIGVKLTGKLSGWTSPKDVILKVAEILGTEGGTNTVLEYFGEGAESISATGKGTICNMGAEVGATTSIFAYDASIARYLDATGRSIVRIMADEVASYLKADDAIYQHPDAYFDRVIEINLSELEPALNGPMTPDLRTPLSKIAEAAQENGLPTKVEVSLIGSCTNSSYEDLSRAASVVKQMKGAGLVLKSEFKITPGSEQVRFTIERDGLLPIFDSVGAEVFANACGPCIGMWDRVGAEKEEVNTIVHSFNRNFAKRADGNKNTMAFVASPEIVTALAIAGDLSYIRYNNGELSIFQNDQWIVLQAPIGDELPASGFAVEDNGYKSPAADGSNIEVIINPDSKRLQLLNPFAPWQPGNAIGLKLLIKVKGKCTTDFISMAGAWLKFRGHLDNISNNLLIGATNFFNGKTDCVKNQVTGEYGPVPATQRAYKALGIKTIVVGELNYGEGSSREHAAMSPRFLGVEVVLVKSFARIHETNLKKQGMLAVTFANPDDYDKIQEDDTFDIEGLQTFAPGQQLNMRVMHSDGSLVNIVLNHSYNDQQIAWFKAGSALNVSTAAVPVEAAEVEA